jgi:hypothetical protein
MDRRDSLLGTCSRRLAALSLGALLLTGCVYNDHASFGMTEKWCESDIHTIPKIVGTPFVAIGDSLISPFTAFADQYEIDWWFIIPVGIDRDEVYHPDHRYLSYAGSRVIGRSNMGLGYQWGASIPSILIETVWLLITGPIDLITVLVDDDGKLVEE